MKKLFFLSAVCGLAVAASAVEVFSCNTVGVQRVTSALSSDLSVPVPFVGIGGQSATLDNLLYIDTLTTGDNVQICQNNLSGYYNVWTAVNLHLPGANIGAFFPSSHTYDTVSGAYTLTTAEAQDFVVHPGTGIKVTHANTNSAVYVMGEYNGGEITTLIKAKTQYYFVNPRNEDFCLDEKLVTGVNAMFDRVYINGRTYYFNKTGSNNKHWYYKEQVTGGSASVINRYDSPVVHPGEGFIYNRATSTDLTFVW